MELRQLRHLIAVVEHGSFSRAAEAVHLTQPALSRSIQALEAEVGAAVLERNRGAIEPTDVGRLLLTHARQLDSAQAAHGHRRPGLPGGGCRHWRGDIDPKNLSYPTRFA